MTVSPTSSPTFESGPIPPPEEVVLEDTDVDTIEFTVLTVVGTVGALTFTTLAYVGVTSLFVGRNRPAQSSNDEPVASAFNYEF